MFGILEVNHGENLGVTIEYGTIEDILMREKSHQRWENNVTNIKSVENITELLEQIKKYDLSLLVKIVNRIPYEILEKHYN